MLTVPVVVPASRPLNRRAFSAAALALIAASAAPAAFDDVAAAPEHVATIEFDWVDKARGRAVPVRLYWPRAAASAAPVPLMVFSHGLGGSRAGYSYLGRAWSARGVASLHVQHVGSDSAVWVGNPLTLFDRIEAAVRESEAVERARDFSFALDTMLDGEAGAFGASIDRRRIVAAGHSYGANTTLVVLGATVLRDGRKVAASDPRFKAGILISAPPFYGERDLKRVLAPVAVPTFHVTAMDDVIELPGRYSPVQDRFDVFNAIGDGRKLLAVFTGGSHSIFTDRPLTGGVALNPQVKVATAEGTLAFTDLIFQGNAASLAAWNDRWRPILAVEHNPYAATDFPRSSITSSRPARRRHNRPPR